MNNQSPMSLWIDTDMGFDDMHALLYLRHAGVTPVAQSLVFGCASLPRVCRNAAAFSELFNWSAPWHFGAAQSLQGETRTAAHVLGPAGLPSRGAQLPEDRRLPATGPALAALQAWLSTRPDNPQILALGPLSNIAELCLQAPELASHIQRITWMGGASARGNQTPYAEFNAWADAEAASIVLAAGIPVCMVDLEVCRQVQLRPEDLLPLSACHSEQGRLLHDLLGGYLNIGLSRGRPGMAIYDPVAAAALLSPEDFEHHSVGIDITLDDEEKQGQSVVQAQPSSASGHEIVTLKDPEGVKTRLLDALLAAADAPENHNRRPGFPG